MNMATDSHYLTRNTQPQVYGDYRTFIAEIASMTNEAILMQKMLSEASSAGERLPAQFLSGRVPGAFTGRPLPTLKRAPTPK